MRLLTVILAILALFNHHSDDEWKAYREAAKIEEDVDLIYAEAQSFFEEGNLYGAKGYFQEVVTRTTHDSTRCAIDFESRLALARIENEWGRHEFARRWLVGINRRLNANTWINYPEGWRQRLAQEHQRTNDLILRAQQRQDTIVKVIIVFAILFFVAMAVFVYLFITKTKAYNNLAKQAERWAKTSQSRLREKTDPDTEVQNMASRIREYIEESKAYLTPGLKIEDIVTALGSNRTYISKAINSTAPNFNAMINEYRIKESVSMITENRNVQLDEVAVACGFNNRKSFNEAFKTFTGLTPSDFKHRTK